MPSAESSQSRPYTPSHVSTISAFAKISVRRGLCATIAPSQRCGFGSVESTIMSTAETQVPLTWTYFKTTECTSPPHRNPAPFSRVAFAPILATVSKKSLTATSNSSSGLSKLTSTSRISKYAALAATLARGAVTGWGVRLLPLSRATTAALAHRRRSPAPVQLAGRAPSARSKAHPARFPIGRRGANVQPAAAQEHKAAPAPSRSCL